MTSNPIKFSLPQAIKGVVAIASLLVVIIIGSWEDTSRPFPGGSDPVLDVVVKAVKYTIADVNLRDAIKGEVIRVLPKNTKVIVLEEGKEWTKVEANNQQGWVATRYLGTEADNGSSFITPIIDNPEPLETGSSSIRCSTSLTRKGIIDSTNFQRELWLKIKHAPLLDKKEVALRENQLLNEVAEKKVEDMFKKQYFEHVSPEGIDAGDLVEQVGYQALAIGENLAMGCFWNDSHLVDKWMGSSGHRKNILRPGFTEIGVAAKLGIFEEQQVWIAVQIFATPLSACPQPDQALRVEIENTENELAEIEKQLLNLNNEIKRLETQKTSLESELKKMETELDRLYEKINALILKGNQALSLEEANIYWSEADNLKKELEEKRKRYEIKYDDYESIIAQANSKINSYNHILAKGGDLLAFRDNLISRYNSQVKEFNSCVEGLDEIKPQILQIDPKVMEIIQKFIEEEEAMAE